MSRYRLLRNAAYLALTQGATQALTAVIYIIFARTMPVSSFGQLIITISAALLMATVVDFGASTTFVRELVADPNQPRFATAVRSRLGWTAFAVALLAVALGLSLAMTSSAIDWSTYAVGIVTFSFATALMRLLGAPMRAALQLGRASLFNLLERIITFAASMVLLSFGAVDALSFLIISAASAFVVALSQVRYWDPALASLRPFHFRTLVARGQYKGSRDFGLSSIAVALQGMDSAVVGATAGPYGAGIYGSVSRWTQPMGLISQAISQSSFAEMVHAETDIQAIRPMKTGLVAAIVVVLPITGVALCADPIVIAILGDRYSDAGTVLSLLAVAAAFSALSAPLSAFLQARHQERITSRIFWSALPCQLAGAAGGVALLGPAGAAAAIAITQGATLVAFILAISHALRTSRSSMEEPPRTALGA